MNKELQKKANRVAIKKLGYWGFAKLQVEAAVHGFKMGYRAGKAGYRPTNEQLAHAWVGHLIATNRAELVVYPEDLSSC